MPRKTARTTRSVLENFDESKARKLRTFIDASARTWLRPPYFDFRYIGMFSVMCVILFFGYLSTRIGATRRPFPGNNNPFFEANVFLMIVIAVFIPVSFWFCTRGWKRQASAEKAKVKRMMFRQLSKVVQQGKKDDKIHQLMKELASIKRKSGYDPAYGHDSKTPDDEDT